MCPDDGVDRKTNAGGKRCAIEFCGSAVEALTIEGRGFASKVSAGTWEDDFFSSECVSCGACVAACPTATLEETSILERDLQDKLQSLKNE